MSNSQLESHAAESLSGKVLDAVAARTNTEPTKLEPPLYDVIDPDALDGLFEPKRDGIARADGEVQFTYCGYRIRVASDGDVRVVPMEE